jgi:hypothetical protein
MVNLEKMSGALLFLFGLIIFLKSLDYPLGSLGLPGAGVFPLLASALLMALSISIIISSHMKRHERMIPKPTFFPAKETPKRIMFGFVSLLAFRYLLPLIGFAPSTFLFIFFLGKVLARYSLGVNVVFSVLTAFVSYYLFQVWLKIPLPKGLFGI